MRSVAGGSDRQRQSVSLQQPGEQLGVFRKRSVLNDGQAIPGTVIESDTQRRIVVTGSVEDSIWSVSVLPQGALPKLRASVVAAAGQFGSGTQSGETGTVDRHQPQFAADFDGGDGTLRQIAQCQNSDRWIPKKGLGETDFYSSSEIAYPEPAVRIVEPVNRCGGLTFPG